MAPEEARWTGRLEQADDIRHHIKDHDQHQHAHGQEGYLDGDGAGPERGRHARQQPLLAKHQREDGEQDREPSEIAPIEDASLSWLPVDFSRGGA